MLLMSRRKAHVDLQFRHLPQPFGSRALLDIGCGNGSFVRLAQSCGWSAVGIDPDPQAVQGAASEGLSVFCGDLQVFEGKQALFDVITMNHVIEHVHEPLDVLRRCHELLRPGGQLWVDTPNIESLGFSLFRENWRGIEAPRHLVLFNRQSLADSLRLVGFAEVRSRSRPDPAPATFRMSDAIRRGRGQDTSESVPLSVRMQIAASAVCSVVAPARREFLTFTAMKA